MTEQSLPRETGSEKASASCPNCGGPVPTVESPYGGISAGACPKCYPATEKAAASPLPPREQGTAVPSAPSAPSQGGS